MYLPTPERRALTFMLILALPSLVIALIATAGSIRWPLAALGIWLTLGLYLGLPFWLGARLLHLLRPPREPLSTWRNGPIIESHLDR